jgi:hypothetical protein
LAPAVRSFAPDRTPYSRHPAQPPHPGGRGAARNVRPVKPSWLRRPWRRSPLGWQHEAPARADRPNVLTAESAAGRESAAAGQKRRGPEENHTCGLTTSDRVAEEDRSRAPQTLRPHHLDGAPCPRPGRLPCAALATVSRTPGISCEAVPASNRDGAGMRRHVHSGNHAAESFVSFIPLFDGVAAPRFGVLSGTRITPSRGARRMVRTGISLR